MSLEVRELTPRGSGAVSVLSITGEGALAAVRALAAGPIQVGIPGLARLRAGEESLDEAIVCAFSAREVELHLHGSPPLLRRVIEILGAGTPAPSTAASVEELARRLLASAPCEAGARILLDQAEGAFTRELASLPVRSERERAAGIEALLARWRVARRALRRSVVLIAGPVNAGKSTLFNALLGERRAIVDAQPGTTRDLNRAPGFLGAWPVELVDTAGERALAAPLDVEEHGVEAQGQVLARAARESADLVLWLAPLARAGPRPSRAPAEAGPRAVLVPTFADRLDPAARPPGAVSALAEPGRAREIVAGSFRAALDLPADPWRPGAAVPFTEELARGIEALARTPARELAAAVEALLRGSGCGAARGPVPSPAGSA